ncbi:MAG: sodium-dependent bicarbonate transport family permease [Candidatus Promineifilaceae bacterium]|jgi:hypothetical protein
MGELAFSNLTSPMILFFVLGLLAALTRSDLTIPESIAKGLSIYLMLAIGFKGGAGVAEHGVDATLIIALLTGIILSAVLPVIAFPLLTRTTRLSRVDAAAIAACYGSISIVTFLAAAQALETAGIAYEGYMVAIAAAMETPPIMVALWLARDTAAGSTFDRTVLREVFLNGSIVVLVGSFIIGWVTGTEGLASISAFVVDPFKGILCLFLLDMGLIAGRGMREGKNLSAPVVAFGIYMPLIGATIGFFFAQLIGLSPGGVALMTTLAASGSYIAVPAAMRVALPDAKPSIYLPLSLGVTFPFNLAVGIPIYIYAASSFQ